ncbi:hypothetical protein Droror1_Dr00021413 [Drosera rotundifolia]
MLMGVGYLVEVRWLLYIFNFGVQLWSEDVRLAKRSCCSCSGVDFESSNRLEVLKAFVHGDYYLFNNCPELQDAMVWVYFHSNLQEYNKVECWGALRDAAGPAHPAINEPRSSSDHPSRYKRANLRFPTRIFSRRCPIKDPSHRRHAGSNGSHPICFISYLLAVVADGGETKTLMWSKIADGDLRSEGSPSRSKRNHLDAAPAVGRYERVLRSLSSFSHPIFFIFLLLAAVADGGETETLMWSMIGGGNRG